MTTPSADTSAALVDALSTLVRNGRSINQRLAASEGALSAPAFTILRALQAKGTLRMAELAAMVNTDVSVVSRQVAALEASEYVERRTDPDDGRAALITISEPGAASLQRMVELRTTWLQSKMGGWTDEEGLVLVGLLNRLAEDVSEPNV